MFEGEPATSRRLPFHFQNHGSVGRLVLNELAVGLVTVDKLELEVADLGTDPGIAAAERFQRRRTRLRGLALRVTQPALDDRVAQLRKALAALGISQLAARLDDGHVSVRARAADGLASADLSFHVQLVSAGTQLRALASAIRVHGQLPTAGPVLADRLLVALLGAGDGAASSERPRPRGLCDVELDVVSALLWHVLPPSGWRLPAVSDIELVHIRLARSAIEIVYGPAGTRGGELGVRQQAHKLAAAHDLMHSVDDQLRTGHLEDAMRGYRALLVSSGPDQPLVLERILALAAARPAWFFDGLELARQALGRWPQFAPAHAALASISLAQGDAREAAKHLEAVARMASGDGDDDQAALAALAAARLLRVLDPRVATQLYELALEHDPGSTEAADSLADRLADEQRWSELVRLMRARAGSTGDTARAVQLHLRLADVFIHQVGDPASAQQQLAAARELAPEDPAVHEMTATILGKDDPAGATAAWREVARLAERSGDHRTCARAWARLGDLLAEPAGDEAAGQASAAEDAWRRALELDPLQADALVGLARAAAQRNEHAVAADLYERLRGLGLPQQIAARHELALARSLVALGRVDDARTSLRRSILAGGEPAAEAHATLAEIADAALDRDHAAAELDTAIASLVDLASADHPEADRLYARAAELAVARAMLFDKTRQSVAAEADWQRAHTLARQVAPEIARDAARTLLARSGHDASLERRWIDAVLATRPPHAERAALLVRRADVRRRERSPDLAAALADLHEAVELTEEDPEPTAHVDTRRRAYQLEAQLFAQSGDQRSRAQALAALARLAERAADRVASETAAAAAWLAADEPAAALPHGARAHASLSSTTEVPAALRREVLVTLGEAAWRQRAWPDVVRAYRGLLEDPGSEAPRLATFRYRLAVAADRAGDQAISIAALRPLVDDPDATRGASPELRGQALRLFADLAERAGELVAAATALESFALIGGDGTATARTDAVYRAGELLRRVDRGDDAIRCFETALRISDTHMPALDALEAAWRERGDLERVAVILGRKVAATARHPSRQKPLLSRLGDLQDQLGRSEVALATHQRALEIDRMWRPSLRYITLGLRGTGQVVAAAGGLAQLAGELHGDQATDPAIVARERQIAAEALSELVAELDDPQLEAVRAVAQPALERAVLDNADVVAGLARLRGELQPPSVVTAHGDEVTSSGRAPNATSTALSLRDAAARARASGKLEDAFATLETANHVGPGDIDVLRELVELATQLQDHAAAARHLTQLAHTLTGARRGDALLELADTYYDKLEDAVRGRDAMRKAADAFGSGSRRDATLRMLATEASTHLAWDIAVDALLAIPLEKRTQADLTMLATALMRAGRDADALASIEAATSARRFDDGGELVHQLLREIQRKIDLARSLEERAAAARPQDATALLQKSQQLRIAIGQPGTQPLRDIAAPVSETPRYDTAPWPVRTKTKPGLPSKRVTPAPAGSRPDRTTPPPIGEERADAAPRSDSSIELPTSADDASPANAVAGAPTSADDEPSSGVPNAALDLSWGRATDASEVFTADAGQDVATPSRTTAAYAAISSDDPAPAAHKRRLGEAFSQPALGRIKLIPRAATRPGVGAVRAPAPAALDDDDTGWQSVSNPALTSSPFAAGLVPGHEPVAATPAGEQERGDLPSHTPAEPSDLAIPHAEPEPDHSSAPTRPIDLHADRAEPSDPPAEPSDLAIPHAEPEPERSSAPTPPIDLHADRAEPSDPPAEPSDLAIPHAGPEPERSSAPTRPIDLHADRAEPSDPPAEPSDLAIPHAEPPPELAPRTSEPQAAEPQTAEPQTAEPQTAEPQDSEPQAAEPTQRSPERETPTPPGGVYLVRPEQPDGASEPDAASLDQAPERHSEAAPHTSEGQDSEGRDAEGQGSTAGHAAEAPDPALPRIPSLPVSAHAPREAARGIAPATSGTDLPKPSVTITGTPDETARALLLAAASADRDRLLAVHRADPDDPSVLLALLIHLGDREPELRREVLEAAANTSHGRALAIALHELAVTARESRDPARAAALWSRAYEADPGYPPVWMPLADALAASDDVATARELYDAVARSSDYDPARRAFAADRAEALGRDDSVISGEIGPPMPAVPHEPVPVESSPHDPAPVESSPPGDAAPGEHTTTDLDEARLLAAAEDWPGAIDAAERAATARPDDPAVHEALERIYLASGNITKASEAIGRQLQLLDDPVARAALWRRRARMYREALGRDAEAYRCLEEAHHCAPADPEIAYQLRTAAIVRGDWQLASALMYREIAAATNPRDRGALHLELALIYEERLGDPALAQVNYEQALAFDPTIPAIKLPLARRYEAIGRSSEAARLYEEAAAGSRAADRASLLEAAARCRATAAEAAEPDLAAQLDRAEAAGGLDAALDLAHQLWRAEPGHAAAFRVLANVHRASGDLAALTELTGVRTSHAETPDERATAWLEVARLAEDVGALDQAARAYDLALIEDPGHVSALDARGALAFRLADFATADLIYRDLGTGESVLGDDELALRRSIIAEQLGRDSESLQHAQTAARLAPGRRDLLARVQELATRIGELAIALAAARQVLDLVPLDDDEGQLAAQFALVELLRESAHLDEAVAQLERILRDHPMHGAAIEALAQIHIARGDWSAATRYLYQLVPLAPTPGHRAERLYQLGEAVLLHVKDIDRADDVFLRASDLDPGHVPTLRRLLDVYWRADDPGGIVEVATELADKGALISGPTSELALARALVAAALVGDTQLAQRIRLALGDSAPGEVAQALAELAGRTGRLQLGSASMAVAELARRGLLDLAKLRAAAAGTAAAKTL